MQECKKFQLELELISENQSLIDRAPFKNHIVLCNVITAGFRQSWRVQGEEEGREKGEAISNPLISYNLSAPPNSAAVRSLYAKATVECHRKPV